MESPKDKLNEKQTLFCDLFASEKEFFGNGTQAYIEAYNVDLTKKGAYASARSAAWRLLTNVDILAYIDSILETAVLNDQFVDKQIAFLITQNADFGSKMSAIKEYNALKQRVTKKLALEVADPIEALLEAYGIRKAVDDDRQDAGSVQSTHQDAA